MGYRQKMLCLSMLCFLGCSHAPKEGKQVYAQGYQAEVKEQIDAVTGQFQGGMFPYYHWSAPMVQEVKVPGHIANGVFIPEHKELVIIKPGEWAQSPAYPITMQGESYEDNKKDMGVNAVDITYLPSSNGVSRGIKSTRESPDYRSGVDVQ